MRGLLRVPQCCSIHFKILRTRGARGEVSVPYKTVDGQAKAGLDYVPVQGTAHFSDGQSRSLFYCIWIPATFLIFNYKLQ